MGEYRVRYHDMIRTEVSRGYWFEFERDGQTHRASVAVSRQLAEMLEVNMGVESGVLVQRAAILLGLPELEQRFRAGVWPLDDDEPLQIVFRTDDRDSFGRLLDSAADKRCLWQARTPRGLLCDATAPGNDKRTTVPICSRCEIPDARVICRHLVHPEISADMGMGVGLMRDVSSVLCDAGHDTGSGEECRPNGKPCWERLVTDTVEDSEPPADVAKAAADEVDYFRLVYRDRYGAPILTVPQARSIAEFFGACRSESDFTRRITALSDLLAHLTPHDQLPDDQRQDANGHRLGSLLALRRLMERDYPAAVPYVENLRRIAKARQVFPIHSRTDAVLEAMRGLGIDYPATDWHETWYRVLTLFWSSLGGVRAAIQSGEPPAHETEG